MNQSSRAFVDRVDVLRADVRRLVARPGEKVLERVVDQIDVALLNARRVLRVDDPPRLDRRCRTSGRSRPRADAVSEGERRREARTCLAPSRVSMPWLECSSRAEDETHVVLPAVRHFEP